MVNSSTTWRSFRVTKNGIKPRPSKVKNLMDMNYHDRQKKNLRTVKSLYLPSFLVLRGIRCLFDSPTNSLSTLTLINHYLHLKHSFEILNSNPLSQELKTRASNSCCSGHKYSGFIWTPSHWKNRRGQGHFQIFSNLWLNNLARSP